MSTPFLISYVFLWILVLVLVVGVYALYHHFGQTYLTSREGREDQGPDVGTKIAAITADDVKGQALAVPPIQRPLLLLFTSTTCKICSGLRAEIRQFAVDHPEVAVTVLCEGHPRAVQAWAEDLADAAHVVADPRSRLTTKYGVGVLPFSVAVGPDGVVRGRGIVNDYAGLVLAAQDAVTALPVLAAERGEGGTVR
jgi:hypothetical protein